MGKHRVIDKTFDQMNLNDEIWKNQEQEGIYIFFKKNIHIII